jgi:putative glutathione S-transferase
MKALIHGVWHSPVDDRAAYDTARAAQPENRFRQWVNADPAAAFPAQARRYHLYVSYACPFAHRTILYRTLLGLQDVLPMWVAHPRWSGPGGWTFTPDPCFPEVTEDGENGVDALWQLYRAAAPDFTGKVTVPVLWDSETRTIVSTESADIMRMLDLGFAGLRDPNSRRGSTTFYPARLRDDIDALGGFVRRRVNGGVYKAGFASDQNSFDAAVAEFFAALDHLEGLLDDGRPYLLGKCASEVDWLLFPTLVRLDAVYAGALKVNLKRLSDYPKLAAHTQRLYDWPGVAATVKLNHVKRHYYDDLGVTNPAIVPPGPASPFEAAA